jgi:hypothetical protein
MIQQFTNGFKSLRKIPDKKIIGVLILCGAVLIYLFNRFHLVKEEEINQLLNNIIQFSGIFSAILITFIVSKVFQIRQERMERRKEIVRLANKTTDFRRIARVLKNCWGFWNKEMKSKMDNKYKELDFFDIHLWDYDNEKKKYSAELKQLRDEFFKEENIPGAYLYLDMKSLVLDDYHTWQLELYDRYDYDYTYSKEILEKWSGAHSGNNLWYCLEHKWHGYEGCFDFFAIRQHDQDEIVDLCKKINPQKYRNSKFDKDLLASVGSEFDGYILPRLHELTYYNTLGLPASLNFLLLIMFLTIISGVLLPLLMTSIKVEKEILLITSNFAVGILVMSLFYFLFKFRKILNTEIKIG